MTSKKLRPLTDRESARLLKLGATLYAIDETIGRLFCQVALGDDGKLPDIYDRFNVLGRFDLADRLKTLMEGRP